MPLLAGLFGRKKSAASDSPLSDYVTADKYLPSSPNGASSLEHYPGLTGPSSTSRLRLPFSRKKQQQHPAASTTSVVSVGQDSVFSTPPRPDSDLDPRRLRPPPSKSAIFAAYADPHNALSTRSLPNDPSPSPRAPARPPVPPKKQGFFNWSKSSSSPPKITPPTDDSFNLKSFRHVGPPSPISPPTPTSPSTHALSPLATPLPRQRGTSTDSSQRISVAAFREAQARRSTAGSPAPSLRAPSPGTQPLYGQPQRQPRRRSSGLAYAASDGDGDEESESPDDDEEEETVRGRSGGRTVSKMRGTKSEVGHGSARAEYGYARPTGTRAQSSHILMSEYPLRADDNEAKERAHSSLGFNVGRQRASVSTSAVVPSRDAKRASGIVGQKPGAKRHSRATSDQSVSFPGPTQQYASSGGTSSRSLFSPRTNLPSNSILANRHSRATASDQSVSSPGRSTATLPPHPISHPSSSSSLPAAQPRARTATTTTTTHAPSSTSTNSNSDSEDDTPLATLVPPRRPGSALSSSSNPRPKPLIDINELTGGRGAVGRERDKGDGEGGFTGGRTLISMSAGVGGVGAGGEGSTSKSPVKVSVSPPRRFVSPPASPKGVGATLGMGLGMDGSASASASGDVERERDGLAERLNRALGAGTKPVVMRTMTAPAPASASVSGVNANTKVETTVTKMRSSTSVGATLSASTSTSTNTNANTKTNTKTKPRPNTKPVVVSHRLSLSPSEDLDLATILGGGVSLIRRTEDESESESEEDRSGGDDSGDSEDGERRRGEGKEGKEMKPIAPIPIKQRAPLPSFSVTSRPPLNRDRERGAEEKEKEKEKEETQRQRSSTLVSGSTPTNAMKPVGILNFPGGGKEVGRGLERDRPPTTRQRSSTLIPGSVSASSLSPIPSTSTSASNSTSDISNVGQGQGQGMGRYGLGNNLNALNSMNGHNVSNHNHNLGMGVGVGSTTGSTIAMPSRPFASGRRESPAGSSTGDSSSGRAPVTPRDGSEVGVGGRHVKRRSVSFEDDLSVRNVRGGGGRGVVVGGGEGGGEDGEERRKERRRSEAKAAIELGNVINGRGPIVDDDDDDLPINQTMASAQARRMSTLNPMMGGMPGWNMNMNMSGMNPMSVNSMNMGMGMSPGMLSPADPGYMAAHQQAMMFAKQAYQMAVAQQAMAAAGDEWERGSTFGGAATASVYGGPSPSVVGTPPFMMGMGMNMMGGMSGGMGMGNGWSTGSVIFPGSSARSMYGGGGGGGMSGSRSEYGGAGGGAGQWSSSKSSYGDYGSSSNRNSRMMMGGGGGGGGRRESGYFPPVPPIPQQQNGSGSAASVRAAPRARTASQPATPSKGARRAPPPSSWRAGGI
ncbi:hypothetical protein C0995_006726 [Termitomyces sp. Mi166|nr:hypothetical protein C0995_006726 [Termitomyces sp. Mi166\